LHAFLRTHAFRRDCTIQDLLRAIATCWVRRATPVDDPIYQVYSIGFHLPPSVESYEEAFYPGFAASLRFLPEQEWKVPSGDEPPAPTRSEKKNVWADLE
jgi:hypothetical protein